MLYTISSQNANKKRDTSTFALLSDKKFPSYTGALMHIQSDPALAGRDDLCLIGMNEGFFSNLLGPACVKEYLAATPTIDMLLCFANGDSPRYFFRCPDMTTDQVLALMQKFNDLYNEKAGDLSEWAGEYQLVSRLLLSNDHAVIINSDQLGVKDCMAAVKAVLTASEGFESAFKTYSMACQLDNKELADMFHAGTEG